MSNEINDGGPAFPKAPYQLRDGMTLRDWFAGQERLSEWDHPDASISKSMMEALAGEEMPINGWGGDEVSMFKFDAKWRASLRYIRADAMLAASKKGAQ